MGNRRQQIVQQLANLLSSNLDGTSPYATNLFGNVKAKQIFWDEVTDYPLVCVYSGGEVREYLPGDFKWSFLTVSIRVYVNTEDSKEEIEQIFDDIESVLDANNTLTLQGNDLCTDIRILSLTDDEGLLAPLGVGEITLEVRYGL